MAYAKHLKALAKEVQADLRKAEAEVERLGNFLLNLTGLSGKSKAKGKKRAGSSVKKVKTKVKKRQRRSGEQVKKQAEAMYAFIKSAGSGGATAGDVARKFGKVIP